MTEPTPGPEHVREYRDEHGRIVYVNVDSHGMVVSTAEVWDLMLTERGFTRKDSK